MLIPICGLWANKDKEGRTYLSGNLGSGKVLIFRNKQKKKETSPDFTLFLGEKAGQGAAPNVADDELAAGPVRVPPSGDEDAPPQEE